MVCEIFIKEEKFDHVLKTRVDHEEKSSLNMQNLESRKAQVMYKGDKKRKKLS